MLLAGAADTPELAAETDAAVAELRAARDGVVLVSEALPRADVRQVLSHATVFVCPSIYEPLGIVNLEAMACGTAVVASDVGGIPEVVADGETGLLVHYDAADAGGVRGRASPPPSTASSPTRRCAAAMGAAGRERAIDEFGWDAAAPPDPGHLRIARERSMKLATIRLDGGHRAVRIDGDAATVLDAADVGALLADPGWQATAAAATGRDARRRPSSTTPRSCRARTRSSASG